MDLLSHSRIIPLIFGPKKGIFHTKPDNFPTIQYILTFIVGYFTQKKEIFATVRYVLTLRQNNCIVPGTFASDKTSSLSFGSGVGDH
jgi:hypothetical protein